MAQEKKVSKVLVVAGPVQLVLGLATLRDIKRRTKAQVRGPRLLWALWGTTNTFGSAMYWAIGRRKAQPAA